MPFLLVAAVLLLMLVIGTIIAGRQISIGPFDEEPPNDAKYVAEYRATLAAPDRTDEIGRPITDVLDMLRRDRDNVYANAIRQRGDGDDSVAARKFFARAANRAALSSAELSIPDALRTRVMAGQAEVRVLIHRRDRDGRLLVAVSVPPAR